VDETGAHIPLFKVVECYSLFLLRVYAVQLSTLLAMQYVKRLSVHKLHSQTRAVTGTKLVTRDVSGSSRAITRPCHYYTTMSLSYLLVLQYTHHSRLTTSDA
jgi:hypothetical protein